LLADGLPVKDDPLRDRLREIMVDANRGLDARAVAGEQVQWMAKGKAGVERDRTLRGLVLGGEGMTSTSHASRSFWRIQIAVSIGSSRAACALTSSSISSHAADIAQ